MEEPTTPPIPGPATRPILICSGVPSGQVKVEQRACMAAASLASLRADCLRAVMPVAARGMHPVEAM